MSDSEPECLIETDEESLPPSPPKKKGKKKKGDWRFQACKIGLTYSCPVDQEDNPIQSKQELLEHAKTLFPKASLCNYIVGQELHESGKRHYHCYLKWDKKCETENVHHFDFKDVHPNILFKPGAGWEKYCIKDDNYLTNYYEPCAWAYAMTHCETAEAAIEHLWQKKPADMCKQGANIEANIRKRKAKVYARPIYYGPYPCHFYPEVMLPELDMKKYSLHLHGSAGLNKTQFAQYWMKHQYGDVQIAKGKVESLKNINTSQPFIHDEIMLLNHDPEDSKEITDVENGGSVTARYNNIDIPPGVPRIFISNHSHPFKNPHDAVYGRRLLSLSLDPPVDWSVQFPN